jgi:protein TonB
VKLKKWLVSGAVGVGVNAVVAVGLAAMVGGQGERDPGLRATVRAVVPPPPPEPEPDPEAEDPLPLLADPATLPPLDLPEPTAGGDAIAVPRTDPSLLALSGAFALPSFVAGQGAKDEMAEAMEVQPAELVYRPDPERFYPRSARAQGIEGRSLVRVRIDARGRVVAAESVESTPHGVFEAAAEAYARQCRYRPARRNGRPEAALRIVEVTWSLHE